jgi:hypothetical protein
MLKMFKGQAQAIDNKYNPRRTAMELHDDMLNGGPSRNSSVNSEGPITPKAGSIDETPLSVIHMSSLPHGSSMPFGGSQSSFGQVQSVFGQHHFKFYDSPSSSTDSLPLRGGENFTPPAVESSGSSPAQAKASGPLSFMSRLLRPSMTHPPLTVPSQDKTPPARTESAPAKKGEGVFDGGGFKFGKPSAAEDPAAD